MRQVLAAAAVTLLWETPESELSTLTSTVHKPHLPWLLQPKMPSKRPNAALDFMVRSRKSPSDASTT